MARMTGIESLEKKIENVQKDVAKIKMRYDAAVAKLGDLMDKRDAIKRDQIVSAIMKSDKSHEKILNFLSSKLNQDD